MTKKTVAAPTVASDSLGRQAKRDIEALVIQPDALCPPALIRKALRRREFALRVVNTCAGASFPDDPPSVAGLLMLGGR
ncbi:MAG: hypothetical protein FKY71_04570 [Spiribacter salinus]|uniref:Uncharacterized protein n=1 Tax=Spiribacter salinus TaxID=1335746 RepID=A0A540VTZ2_9GAMM|nr:MAG: hypothetical protein FKY71_04570 [Spiribacter salinus]